MSKDKNISGDNFTDERHRLMFHIVSTASWIQSHAVDYLAPYGLSSPQFNILRILRGAEEWLSMQEIKNRMVEKSPNTTRLCDKLVAKELVERKRSEEDRRVVYLNVTKKGLELLLEIDKVDAKKYFGFMENLTEEEAKIVNQLLVKFKG